MTKQELINEWETETGRQFSKVENDVAWAVTWVTTGGGIEEDNRSTYEEAFKLYRNVIRRKSVESAAMSIQAPDEEEVVVEEEWLTYQEAAAYMQVRYQQVANRVARHRMPAQQIEGRWRVKKSDLLLWEDARALLMISRAQQEFAEVE